MDSRGATVEGGPRRQPWVGVLEIGSRKAAKEKILVGPNSIDPDGAVGEASKHFENPDAVVALNTAASHP